MEPTGDKTVDDAFDADRYRASVWGVTELHAAWPGTIKDHTLVYSVVIAGFLTVFFDLSRNASLGAF